MFSISISLSFNISFYYSSKVPIARHKCNENIFNLNKYDSYVKFYLPEINVCILLAVPVDYNFNLFSLSLRIFRCYCESYYGLYDEDHHFFLASSFHVCHEQSMGCKKIHCNSKRSPKKRNSFLHDLFTLKN